MEVKPHLVLGEKIMKLLTLLLYFSLALYVAFSQEPANHAQAEQAIHQAQYEHTMAGYKGDVQEFKKHVASRYLKLHQLAFDLLSQETAMKNQFKQIGVNNNDDYLKYELQAMAKAFAGMSGEEKEKKARENSSGKITFVNDHEATLQVLNGTVRAVLENNEWKIDGTEGYKTYLLRLPLKKESLAKIKEF
jgi:hypothetical protein